MKFLKLWLPVFIWCGFIFYLSGIPGLATPWGIWDLILRKFAHITEYFVLTLLLYRALKGSFKLAYFYLIFWSLSLSFLYAVSDEIHQGFVYTRNASPADVLIDTLGMLVSYLLIRRDKFKKSP